MNNTILLTNNEYKDILNNFFKNKSFNTIKLFKIKREPLVNLKELLLFNSKTINYIPIDILNKYKDWILLNLIDLDGIDIFKYEVQETIFKDSKNILDYNTIKTIIKNSSNPFGLYKANSNIFPLNYIMKLPHISEKKSTTIYKKLKSNKISLTQINKTSSIELLLILGTDCFTDYLKNNLYCFTEDSIYHFHTMLDINFLLSYNNFKPRKYLNFLLKSTLNKDYLKLFLKNTNISHYFILLFFNKDIVNYYLNNNKNLSIDNIIKLHQIKSLNSINWANIYKSHLDKINEDNILFILNNIQDINSKKDILSMFLEKNNFYIDNLKTLSKENLFNPAINKEISHRFKSIVNI